jgi:integrase
MPPVAACRGARLPQGLSSARVDAVLNGYDRSTNSGRRDYAVLCLLARLGHRSGEVAALQLGDIDWRLGEIVVRVEAVGEIGCRYRPTSVLRRPSGDPDVVWAAAANPSQLHH